MRRSPRAVPASSKSVAGPIATFGELLKHLRRDEGMTQKELGNAVGYSEAQIARLEGGKRLPDIVAVKTQFVTALGLQLEPSLSRRLIDMAAAAHDRSAADRTRIAQSGMAAENNLPLLLTTLFDRERDIAAVRDLLSRDDVRLITLLGPPGVGKTSLAIEAARAVCSSFAGGAWFVSLAPVYDPALVPMTIAQTMGLEPSAASPLASLKTQLRGQHVLLLLDNFEHLLAAATDVAEIVASGPHVKIIVTSRAALRLTGEYVVDVHPLRNAAAVEMFIDRAQRIKPDLILTPRVRSAISDICRYLDGLPLGIELAAARLRLFSPQALLARLVPNHESGPSGALSLLTEGPRNLPERQRTLRATMAWSYGLLSVSQQHLLRALSVFADGCTFEAAQTVDARRSGIEDGSVASVTSDLQSLVDGSLVQRMDGPHGEPRFNVLAVIRDYAAEQLEACGEAKEARRRHFQYFLEYARSSAPESSRRLQFPLVGQPLGSREEARRYLRRLYPDRDNIRAALDWGLREANDVRSAIELVLWQYPFWGQFGPWEEATGWLERALASADPVSQPRERAALQSCLSGYLVMVDNPRAAALAREAIETIRRIGNEHEVLVMLPNQLTVALESNRLDEVQRLGAEMLALARQQDSKGIARTALFYLGDVALVRKDFARAEQLFALSAEGSSDARPDLDNMRGTLACYQGNYAAAAELCGRALEKFQHDRFAHGIGTVRHSLGDIALFKGDPEVAMAHYREGLQLFSANVNRQRSTWCLAGIAAALASAGQYTRTVTLWSAVETIRAAIGSPRPPLRDEDYRACVERARGQLDHDELQPAEATGRALSFERTVDYALG